MEALDAFKDPGETAVNAEGQEPAARTIRFDRGAVEEGLYRAIDVTRRNLSRPVSSGNLQSHPIGLRHFVAETHGFMIGG